MNPDCAECGGTGWKVIKRGGVEGVAKCPCRLPQPEQPKTGLPVTTEKLAAAISGLSALGFFPSDDIARGFIAKELNAMCATAEQLAHVTTVAIRLYKRWDACGLAGLRQIFCRWYRPKDGIEAGATEAYPDGITNEVLGLPPAPQPLGIASGNNPRAPVAIADPVAREIRDSAVRKVEVRGTLPPIRRIVPQLNEPDDQALHRAFTEDLARPVPKPRLPTEDEIAEIKRKQAEAAKEDATRDILSKGNSA